MDDFEAIKEVFDERGGLFAGDIAFLITEIERLRGMEARLKTLIENHQGKYILAPAEIQNVLEPGSAPMYPREAGYAATCSLCAPDGDGVSFRRGKK